VHPRPLALRVRLNLRRTQIQIILYFMKLSVTQVTSPPSQSKSSPSKRGRGIGPPERVTPTAEERLESFMDKLSMWQLLNSIDDSKVRDHTVGSKNDRDWMQTFCEDIVEAS
jgi:hypothetical protein